MVVATGLERGGGAQRGRREHKNCVRMTAPSKFERELFLGNRGEKGRLSWKRRQPRGHGKERVVPWIKEKGVGRGAKSRAGRSTGWGDLEVCQVTQRGTRKCTRFCRLTHQNGGKKSTIAKGKKKGGRKKAPLLIRRPVHKNSRWKMIKRMEGKKTKTLSEDRRHYGGAEEAAKSRDLKEKEQTGITRPECKKRPGSFSFLAGKNKR